VNPIISDPEYLKELKNGFTAGHQRAGPINIPSGSSPWSSAATATSPVSLVSSLLHVHIIITPNHNIITCLVAIDGVWIGNWIYCTLIQLVTTINYSTITNSQHFTVHYSTKSSQRAIASTGRCLVTVLPSLQLANCTHSSLAQDYLIWQLFLVI
jgi:hypothetical protein